MARPEVGGDRGLHVGGHGLNRLLADFGERAPFVDHPTRLAPHPQGAGLAGILATQRLVELPSSTRFAAFLNV